MSEALHNAGRKALVVALALVGGWILFKIVLGVITAVAWTLVVILALAAIVYVLFFW